MDKVEFKRTMDGWLQMLKATKPAPGHDRVLYPGLPEAECEKKYRSNGIPLHHQVVALLRKTCRELKTECYV